MVETAAEVAWTLGRYRFAWASERELQDGIERVIQEHGWPYLREHRLSEHDRPDFFLTDLGCAIEVKIKGAAADLLRQIERYMEHDAVRAVIVVTTKRQHQFGCAWGKPVFFVHLWSL